eukprot:scaffold75444_cov17-Tisochrysis_lutea.AAC.1
MYRCSGMQLLPAEGSASWCVINEQNFKSVKGCSSKRCWQATWQHVPAGTSLVPAGMSSQEQHCNKKEKKLAG